MTPTPETPRVIDLDRYEPDQPQATFVKQFGVHPLTVRRCRRELEEGGAIPVLPHRHGHSLGGRRRAHLAEAAD